LFTTSFFLVDFLDDNNYFDADKVLLTIASSKTSIELAQSLNANRSCQVKGLTSASNQSFAEGLGCYTQVLICEQVGQLEKQPNVMVNMTGNGYVRRAVHTRLDGKPKYSCAVGTTHPE